MINDGDMSNDNDEDAKRRPLETSATNATRVTAAYFIAT